MKSQRILVTGASGFVGPHALRAFRNAGHDVVGATRSGTWDGPDLAAFGLDGLEVARLDLTDADSIEATLQRLKPAAVLHLAGESNVARSWNAPETTWEVNVLGTLRLARAMGEIVPDSLLMMTGSGDVYGTVLPDDLPLRESRPARPNNPYAASKLAAEAAVRAFGGMRPRYVLLRPFAHTGPGQSPDFACPAFARQIVAIEQGRQEPILMVGNLEARRDYSDVRDVTRAYVMAYEAGITGGPYNICSGMSHSMQDVLDRLLGHYQGNHTVSVVTDPDRLRPVDTPEIRGDSSIFREATGWQPETPFARTLADLLDHERARLAAIAARQTAGPAS